MDYTKKRKLEDTNNNVHNNSGGVSLDASSGYSLTPVERRKMIEQFTKDQLIDILQDVFIRHLDVRSAVRSIADTDLTQRKLFIRGLGSETTTENLLSIFLSYGEIDDAIVVQDKATGKSKGYGFVIFKHVDGALLALREPSKKIGGRVTVTQLAAAGGQGAGSADVHSRKIYVGNVPMEASPEKLLSMFSQFGDIEEGPLGFDKQTGKSRGFSLFVYKTVEGAQSALLESVKNFEGRQLFCRLAIDGKKKMDPAGAPGNVPDDGLGVGGPPWMREGQHGSGGFGNLGGYPGGMQGPSQMGHYSSPSMGGSGIASGANWFGGGGGTGYGPFGGYNMGGGYGGVGSGVGPGGFGGSVVGNVGGFGSAAGGMGGGPGGTPMSRPPASGYPEAGPYGMTSLGIYAAQLQHHQPTGNSPALKVPPSGSYPSGPPYR